MGERDYETPIVDYSPFPIEDFKVGDKIYDKRTGNRITGEVIGLFRGRKFQKLYVIVKWEDGDIEHVLSDWIQKEPEIDYFDSRFVKEKEKVKLWNEDSPFYTDREPKDLKGLALKVPDERDLTTFTYEMATKTGTKEEKAEEFILKSTLRYDKESKTCYFLKGNRKMVSSYDDPENMDFYVDEKMVDARDFFNEDYDDIIIVGCEDGEYYIDWDGKCALDSEEELMHFVGSMGFDEEKVLKIIGEDGSVELRV